MSSSATVLITCYNLEEYVGAAVESVLAQDFGGHVELIVVDDCSTDRSEEIIRSFPLARYLRTARNGGVLLAMLAGIESASNDIVCLLDGDDLWRPDKLRRVYDCFSQDRRIALVTHDLDFMDAAGRQLPRPSRPEQVLTEAAPEKRADLVRSGILLHDDYVWLGSALAFRRSAGRVDEFASFARALPDPANVYQDWPLAFWLAALPDVSCRYIGEKLFSYRLHGANHSGDASDPAKAVRNFRRERNTMQAIVKIAEMHRLGSEIVDLHRKRARFSDYLVDLYSGRRGRAIGGWMNSQRDLTQRGLFLKELVRFAAVQLLGPRGFTSMRASLGRLNGREH